MDNVEFITPSMDGHVAPLDSNCNPIRQVLFPIKITQVCLKHHSRINKITVHEWRYGGLIRRMMPQLCRLDLLNSSSHCPWKTPLNPTYVALLYRSSLDQSITLDHLISSPLRACHHFPKLPRTIRQGSCSSWPLPAFSSPRRLVQPTTSRLPP